jgi:hypothetical protein
MKKKRSFVKRSLFIFYELIVAAISFMVADVIATNLIDNNNF